MESTPSANGTASALPRRWLILGAGGAGKSTLATDLGRLLDLPVIHLDRHYWRPGWSPRSDVEWKEEVSALVQKPEWIMDGNYSRTLSIRLPRAEVAVLLDPPTLVCLWGVIKRGAFVSSRGRTDLPDGCREQLPSFEFLRYVATYKWRWRPKVLKQIRGAEHVRLIHLKSRRDADRFLSSFPWRAEFSTS